MFVYGQEFFYFYDFNINSDHSIFNLIEKIKHDNINIDTSFSIMRKNKLDNSNTVFIFINNEIKIYLFKNQKDD